MSFCFYLCYSWYQLPKPPLKELEVKGLRGTCKHGICKNLRDVKNLYNNTPTNNKPPQSKAEKHKCIIININTTITNQT